MSETKTYSGSCHCGKVRFEVTTEISRASACNCSICSRTGWLMASVPPAQFNLLAGADAQTDYQFGKKTMHHLFCSTCGIRRSAGTWQTAKKRSSWTSVASMVSTSTHSRSRRSTARVTDEKGSPS